MMYQDELDLIPGQFEPIPGANNDFDLTNFTAPKAEFDLLHNLNGIQGKNKILAELIGKRWKIFTCSRLFDISYSKFPSISRTITERLNATEITNTRQKRKFSTNVSVIDRSISGIDHGKPIEIEITTDRSETLYKGFLFAWQPLQEYNDENEYVDLPLLFCTGTAKYLNLINGILMDLFHSTIDSLFISQKNFIWIFVLIVQQIKSSSDTTAQLIFNTALDTSCTFHVILELEALKKLWNSINEGEYGTIREKDITLFYSALQKHLSNVYQIDFTYCNLQGLDVSQKITINNKGKIKLSKMPLLETILKFLSDFVCTSN